MDKKKVKKHIQRALAWVDPMTTESANYEMSIKMAAKNLEFAMNELSKSDWVSVEDGLPEYNKDVIVCCTKFPDIVYVTYREDRGNYSENEFAPIMDDNDFVLNTSVLLGKVTHWKPIEKLEE